MKGNRINDEEWRLWVLNEEGLYNEHLRSGIPMLAFIRANRERIDEVIRAVLSKGGKA